MAPPPPAFRVSPSSSVPIHRQLMDQVVAAIAAGRLKPGELVPSVRELARSLEVNPTTISKAFVRLEEDGLLERRPGIGMAVAVGVRAAQASAPLAERRAEVRPLVVEAVLRARQVGLTDKQIQALLDTALSENPDA